MYRRRFLAAAGVAALAGCLAPSSGSEKESSSPEPEEDAATTLPRTTETDGIDPVGNTELPVPESELSRGAPRDGIPAIVDPEFGEDWSGVSMDVNSQFGEYTANPRLTDDDRVIGVVRDGEARAYPLRVLNWHEVVNDDLDGPLLVTFCPLCGSSLVADRRVDGESTVFGVSGLLWKANLVMYDEATDSRWSQISATAIRGPKTGERLTLLPSTLTTWRAWQRNHPDTKVLRPPPESDTVVGPNRGVRDYTRNPYAAYEESNRVGIGRIEVEDDRLHPKTNVLGVESGGEARAYPLPAVQEADVVNGVVGDRPVVVAAAPGDTLVAYDRRIDGRRLEFEADGDAHLLAGGTRFERLSGEGVEGPLADERLAGIGVRTFWFAWAETRKGTDIFEP